MQPASPTPNRTCSHAARRGDDRGVIAIGLAIALSGLFALISALAIMETPNAMKRLKLREDHVTAYYVARGAVAETLVLEITEAGPDAKLFTIATTSDLFAAAADLGHGAVVVRAEDVGDGLYVVEAVANQGDLVEGSASLVRVVAGGTRFQQAVLVGSGSTANNDLTIDSYSSQLGSYQGQVTGSGYALANGGLVSNGPVEVNDGTINGDVTMLAGEALDVTGVFDFNGAIVAADAPAPVEPVVFAVPGGALAFPAKEAAEYRLDGGVYVVDSLALNDMVWLHIRGDSTLYIRNQLDIKKSKIRLDSGVTLHVVVDGDVSFVDTKIENPNGPPAFQISVAGPQSVVFYDDLQMDGAILAPESIFVAEGELSLFGAIVADTATFENATDIHFDEALQDVSAGSDTVAGNVEVLDSWRLER